MCGKRVEGGRTASTRDWRTVLSAEAPARFFAFGQPVLAPASGRVVASHDGEPDHVARRSPLTLVPYAVTQAGRARRGADELAGNHLIVELDGGGYVLLAHLRAGSLRVDVGDRVVVGQQLAACGNSGNSTQPHIHIQAMDAMDPLTARGLPMDFEDYRVWHRPDRPPVAVALGIPAESEVIEPL
jgi:murein DD-endopeptidase MepM/ murein hydrolase activator NlpD